MKTLTQRLADLTNAEGIAGWLLLLCVWLTVFVPLSLARSMYNLLYLEGTFPGHTPPALSGLVTVSIVIEGILAVFSLVAGISLWTVRPGAVVLARIYFVVALLFSLAQTGVWLTVFPSLGSALVARIVTTHVMALGVAVLWLLYLGKSARVKALFGQLNPADVVSLRLGTPTSPPDAAETRSGVYINTRHTDQRIELRANGAFRIDAHATVIEGHFRIEGDSLTLTAAGGPTSKVVIRDGQLLDNEGNVWCRL